MSFFRSKPTKPAETKQSDEFDVNRLPINDEEAQHYVNKTKSLLLSNPNNLLTETMIEEILQTEVFDDDFVKFVTSDVKKSNPPITYDTIHC